ncbi:hypothetical protein GH714_035679 [Hevea brasiliensis]|uniref:Non-haem dioxygenase N-terminal domain-containing protein n=1 Tax=Hevea brasiliensis TaxID=3981 RepID=A0A6A6KTD9_HEVBR|nr:hypothetical protein GH714_035679 [Hevea brasiliensis]
MSTATPNASSDVLDFVVHKANGLKGLVDTGLQSLPRHISNHQNEAASKWGFFQIINHGIPQEILDHLQDAAHGFFGLPNEERKKFWKGKSPTDTAFLATSFTPLKEKVLEWKDYLSFRYIPGDEKSQTLWPSVCKDPVLDYMKRVEMVIKKLLELLLTKLNIMSNDQYKSIEHRVVANGSKNRVSVPIFVNPGPDALIGPLPEVLETGAAPRYKPILFQITSVFL